jgi:uroporphyrinogen decarboxylase
LHPCFLSLHYPTMPRIRFRDCLNNLHLPDSLWHSPFLAACRGEQTPFTPVWLMRQAGRYMREYREVRAKQSFLELCKDPALAAEVTIYARHYLGVDAAIIFSDILVVLEALGMPLTFVAGDGPNLPQPVRSAADVAKLREAERAAEDLAYVYQAIRLCAAGLPANIPLIGFCGAPFTLASYAIEGGGSRDFARTKAFMHEQPTAWHALLSKLTETLSIYLRRQVEAGATALQIFDSWAGTLSVEEYRALVLPHLSELVAQAPSGVPVIVFAVNAAHLARDFAGTGCDVLGIDQHTDLARTWSELGGPSHLSVQGNLDPQLLLGPLRGVTDAADNLLASVRGKSGHIFNLGHGVLKETDPEIARALVAHVHQISAQR